MKHLVAIPLLSTVLVVAGAATAQTPAAQSKFPPEGWARLAAIEAQVNECLKAASKSPRQGMECKFAQANELPPLDRKHREWFGEFYDPAKYRKCLDTVGQATNVACEYLRLMREPEPEYWPYPDVPRPKWPEAPNPPTYKRGMSSKQYFEALCKAEAGEFIYATVNEVEGVYQIRPRKQVSEALYDRFVMEDPYGYTNSEASRPEVIFLTISGYRFFEAPPRQKVVPKHEAKRFHPSMLAVSPQHARVERYLRVEGSSNGIRKEYDEKLTSRYGFTWRGIARPHDRELAVVGGELAVVDLQTGEVLGIRRGFARSGLAKGSRAGIQWETAGVCPRLRLQPDGFDKAGEFSSWFLVKVLKPKKQ